MAAVRDPLTSLGITSELLATRRFRFLEDADRQVIQGIQLGVLFIMAFWSGPARAAFHELKRVLAEIDPNGRKELLVVDTDSCPDLCDTPEFRGRVHGWGETAWIRGGGIVVTSVGRHPECFAPNTRALLGAANSEQKP
jgi:hypothetical protein